VAISFERGESLKSAELRPFQLGWLPNKKEKPAMNDRKPIPNINIGQVYDQRYSDAEVHYDKLGNLADFFGRNMPVHRHDRFFQVHYVKSGSVRVYLDDQQYLESGPMFFITPPTVAHSFVTEADADGHVLTVRQQLVWGLIDADPALVSGSQLPAACVALAQFPIEVRRLEFLFEELSNEINTAGAGRSSALDNLTRLIMINLLRLCANSLQARPARQEDLRIFHRFNELIEHHYLQHWPLSRYAEGVGVTEARLNDVCRRIADLPSKRLVLERVMQEAKRLLLFTGSSASEICYQLGFKDPAYFSRFFQRYAHMTPGEYRLQQSGLR
jgi:AraC family 4-hydroxyphenylacetate 3-monooxygenase operon regulatory protein